MAKKCGCKGKGILFKGEVIRRKSGKTAAAK